MFVRKSKVKGNATAVRIVENYRDGKKVRQRIIKYIGQSKDPEEILMFEQMARTLILKSKINTSVASDNNYLAPPDISINSVEEVSRINNGIFDIFGKIYDEIGLSSTISGTRNDKEWNSIIRSLVLLRLYEPTSKNYTRNILLNDFAIKIPLEKIYRAMDRLHERTKAVKNKILKQTKSLNAKGINCLLYDVTTLYFESFDPDELRNFGFSKDCKFKETQIVLSLLTTDEGLPVGYMTFPGNTTEGKTLIDNIMEMKNDLGLESIKLFADRAMFTEENLDKMDDLGVKYVVAAKLKSMSKKMKEKILFFNDYDEFRFEKEGCKKKELEYKKRRLIVSYSPRRAEHDRIFRDRLVERLMKKARNNEIKLSSLITNSGSKRFINVKKDKAVINEEKIKEDSKWDGLHGVVTNDKLATHESVLAGYRKLFMIEDAFRMSKSDLKMRPIYHWKKERIESHILICYMALAIGKFTLKKLKTKISLRSLSDELSKVQSSILKDKSGKTSKLMVLPSQLNEVQSNIYNNLNVERHSSPWIM